MGSTSQYRNPRNRASAIGQYDAGVLTLDYASSARQLDILMRLNGGQIERYMPLLLAISQDPSTHDTISSIAIRNPAWVQKFIQALVKQEGARPVLSLKIIEDAMDAPLNADAVQQTLIARLAAIGEYKQAKQIWGKLNFKKGEEIRYVYDGNFVGLKGPQPFNWYMHQSEHGYGVIEPEHGLFVSSSGRTRVTLAHQLVVLQQNKNYLLQVNLEGQFQKKRGAFGIWLVCVGSGRRYAEIKILQLKAGKQEFTKPFVLRDAKCKAQHLQIYGAKVEYPSQVSLTVGKVDIVEVGNMNGDG